MKRRILIVDDEKDLLTNIRVPLVAEGYVVETATLLAEAREKLSANVPSLLFLDIMLPDGNGLALLDELRRDETTRELPVIILSALNKFVVPPNTDSEKRLAYLDKPYHIADLLKLVKLMLPDKG